MNYNVVIEQDQARFRQIVRGKIKQNLRKYMSQGELIGRQGRDLVSIPVPKIDLPHFRFNRKQQGGVGQGEGQVGQPIGREPGKEPGPAGDQPGQHIMEVEMTLQELADILGEELALPRIEPRGKKNVDGEVVRYTGIRRVGPEGLRSFKRTYRATLRRQIITGTYNPNNPVIVPIRDDMRYRSWKTYPLPHNNAVIFYLMDVSGSMSQKKKELVRLTAFWIDTWLRTQYRNLDIRYIVHDAAAKEVDQHTFYHLRESGGTRISSAFELCHRIMNTDYDPEDWNMYVFHFTDGENFGEDDQRCRTILEEKMLPHLNMFAYGQVRGGYGRLFMETVKKIEDERVVAAKINESDDIYDAIKAFLGKGY